MTDLIERVARAICCPTGCRTKPCVAQTGDCPIEAQAAITAYKAALADAGYVVVPREPTEEMVVAGCRHENMGDMAGRWKAMINAAEDQQKRAALNTP